MAETSKCVISQVDDLETAGFNPIIINFQNGVLQAEAAKDLDCGVYESKVSKGCCVAVSDATMSYIGHEDLNNTCQTFVAVRKRTTNEVRIVAAKRALLGPILRTQKITRNQVSQQDQIVDLAKKFGTKKLARAFEKRVETSVEAVQDELTASASKVKTEDTSTPVGFDTFKSCLPPCNRKALRPKEVYDLDDIVTNNELLELEAEAIRLLEVGEEEFNNSNYRYSALYKLLFQHVVSQERSDEEKIKKLCLLTYAEFIISIITVPAYKLQKPGFVACPASERLNEKLLNNFTLNSVRGRCRTLELKDKGICQVIIIALLLHRFKVPYKEMLQTFSIRANQLVTLCQMLGLTKVMEDGAQHASLQLPLAVETPQKPSRFSRSKRR